MIHHPAITNLLPGLHILVDIPEDKIDDVDLTHAHVAPFISTMSTDELTRSLSTLIYGVLFDLVSEDNHPGVYVFLWNNCMDLLSALKLINCCDGLEDFLPNTTFQRHLSYAKSIIDQWLGSTAELRQTLSTPNLQTSALSLEEKLTSLRDHALYHLLALQYLSHAPEEVLLFLCEEILANSPAEI